MSRRRPTHPRQWPGVAGVEAAEQQRHRIEEGRQRRQRRPRDLVEGPHPSEGVVVGEQVVQPELLTQADRHEDLAGHVRRPVGDDEVAAGRRRVRRPLVTQIRSLVPVNISSNRVGGPVGSNTVTPAAAGTSNGTASSPMPGSTSASCGRYEASLRCRACPAGRTGTRPGAGPPPARTSAVRPCPGRRPGTVPVLHHQRVTGLVVRLTVLDRRVRRCRRGQREPARSR